MTFDPKLLDNFPLENGVYLMKDASGKVLYVGKAKQLRVRLKQYFAKGRDTRAMIPLLLKELAHIDTIVVLSEKEALILENTLIKQHQPRFNAVLKDDKGFISLCVNHQHPWPMIQLVRYKGNRRKDLLYFGPYTSAYAARQTYDLLTRLFPLRQCSDEELKRRTRPCLLYDIKRCIAPCTGKCTKQEYDGVVQEALKFLKGQNKQLLKSLYEQMKEASDTQEYERAGALLKTIRYVEHVLESQPLVVNIGSKNSDILGLYRQGEEVMIAQLFFREGKLSGSKHYSFAHILEEDEALLSSFLLQHYRHQELLPEEIILPISLKDAPLIAEILSTTISSPQRGTKKALVEMAEKNAKSLFEQEKDLQEMKEKILLDLQETLKLTRYPKRIECFDISHTAGAQSVASLAAFTNGEKDVKRGRLFNIKNTKAQDDYGAMKEVLTRRLTRLKAEDDLPDLIIVDGGKGQLNVALRVFKELDIASVDLIALAKEKGRHDKGITLEAVFLREDHDPIHLNPRSNLLFLLQTIRDETHRKAITFHRKKRSKHLLVSALDSLEGIGPIKKRRLLTHFGSVEKIFQASEEALSQVRGITKKDIAILRAQKK